MNELTDERLAELHGGSVRPIESDADGQFIAHAREDIPALMAEVEQLRATNTELVGEKEQ